MTMKTITVASVINNYMYDDAGHKVAVYSERQCKWFALTWVQKLCKHTNTRLRGIQQANMIVTDVKLNEAAWHDLQRFEPDVYSCIKGK